LLELGLLDGSCLYFLGFRLLLLFSVYYLISNLLFIWHYMAVKPISMLLRIELNPFGINFFFIIFDTTCTCFRTISSIPTTCSTTTTTTSPTITSLSPVFSSSSSWLLLKLSHINLFIELLLQAERQLGVLAEDFKH